MFFKKDTKEMQKMREEMEVIKVRLDALSKVISQFFEELSDMRQFPYGKRKDGEPKQKPGRKTK